MEHDQLQQDHNNMLSSYEVHVRVVEASVE